MILVVLFLLIDFINQQNDPVTLVVALFNVLVVAFLVADLVCPISSVTFLMFVVDQMLIFIHVVAVDRGLFSSIGMVCRFDEFSI